MEVKKNGLNCMKRECNLEGRWRNIFLITKKEQMHRRLRKCQPMMDYWERREKEGKKAGMLREINVLSMEVTGFLAYHDGG